MTEKLGHVSGSEFGTTGNNAPSNVGAEDVLGVLQRGRGGQQAHQLVAAAYVVTTGSAMLDQFVPWYFGVAFAFFI